MSEERLELAQAVACVGTWDADLVSGETTWSRALRGVLGVDESAPASYEAFLALVHPDDRERVDRATTAVIERGGYYEVEYRLCRPDGELRFVLARGRSMHDEHGRPVRILGVAMDVTRRKMAEREREDLERQLREAQRLEAVGRLAGGIAHDFNNILLGLRGYGELALRAIGAGEDPREEIEEMLVAADRAGAVVRQLLAFGRRQLLRPEVLDLNEIVSDIDGLLRRLIGEDIELERRLSPDPVYVHADRGQLEQVLMNLAANARDAMATGGQLVFEVGSVELDDEHGLDLPAGRYALLAVSDTGRGMTTETAAQIFEPFFTTKDEGSGLGLATVHGIVSQSGGSVWVYSELARGTTFKVYLPLTQPADRAAEALREPPPPVPNAGGERILLVEDNTQVRAITTRMLRLLGYEVVAAENGDKALALAAEIGDLDLLLTDLVLPGRGGHEIAEQLRRDRPRLRVLYMSGYTDDAVARRGVVEGSAAFLAKPFSSETLARRVREVLDAPRDE